MSVGASEGQARIDLIESASHCSLLFIFPYSIDAQPQTRQDTHSILRVCGNRWIYHHLLPSRISEFKIVLPQFPRSQ